MVKLKTIRNIYHKNWTISTLFFNDTKEAYFVEDEIRKIKVKGETAIPTGIYFLTSRYSPKFSKEYYWSKSKLNLIPKRQFLNLKNKLDYKEHELIWITNVPNFEYILIHWGNTDLDTEGCLVIGKKLGVINGRKGVIESRKAYIDFYKKAFPLLDNNSTIEIING